MQQVLTKFINGDDWTSSERFPRVTICDFLVRCIEQITLFAYKAGIYY